MFILFCILFLLGYLCNPSAFVSATQDGILLWAERILPVLLPFSILSSIVIQTGMIQKLRLKSSKSLRITFPELLTIGMGFFFGFPLGAKLTADLYTQGEITKRRAQIVCGFANQFSVMFLYGYVADLLSLDSLAQNKLLCFVLLPPLVLGVLRLLLLPNYRITHKKTASRFQVNMQIVDAGIMSGFEILMKLCGYIIFFAIASRFLMQIPWVPYEIKGIVSGMLEPTNGIHWLAESTLLPYNKYLLAILYVSFGGISGFVQTKSVLAQTNLSARKYLSDKLLYTSISVGLCILDNCITKI